MAFQGSTDAVNAVVADMGSFATKIGWAGDDIPKSYFRSNVATLRETGADKGRGSGRRQRDKVITKVKYDYYTHPCNPSTFDDGSWTPLNPVDAFTGLWYDRNSTYGADWCDLLEQFLRHGYDTGLQAKMEEHPLLLVERSYNPPAIRQQALEFLFEQCNVPAVFVAKDAVLSCYGSGRTTATVVDVGYSGTVVTPVHDGYAEVKGIKRSPVGVHAMDTFLLHQLDTLNQKRTKKPEILPIYQVRPVRPNQDPPGQTLPRQQRSSTIHTAARLQIAQECRELGAGAALSSDTTAAFQAPHKPYTLPDDTVLDIPSATRFSTADLIYGSSVGATTGSSSATASGGRGGNDVAGSPQAQELYEATRKQLDELLELDKNEDGAMDEQENDGDEAEDEKYSTAAAVGLSKRRSKRTPKPTNPTATRPSFSNRILREACRPYIQTLRDEQLTAAALPNMICDAAYSCDRDQQAALLGNVVVGGGGTCLGPTEQSVPDRVRQLVEALIHRHTPGWRVKVTTPSIRERALLPWLGGSILGSLGSFPAMWIAREEYEEWGSAVVNRKCP